MKAIAPLDGLRVVELAGLGPGPFCGMLLADLGAEVVCIQRPSMPETRPSEITARGKQLVRLDLSDHAVRAAARDLIGAADVLIDPYRPGVTERLGLGPTEVLGLNPRLVYGRMTGWGQDGPFAQQAGHDINYLALNGTLHLLAVPGECPRPPLNLLGDYGGGALFLAFGLVSAVLNARVSGHGQVVDAAMVDGSALLATVVHELSAGGHWRPKGQNVLESASPYYRTYETSDGRYVAVGAVEGRFFRQLVGRLDLDVDTCFALRRDPSTWPQLTELLAEKFHSGTMAHWSALFEGTDCCVTPVLTLDEAEAHPHLMRRATFVRTDGVRQPAPAPRFSGSPPPARRHGVFDPAAWGVTTPHATLLNSALVRDG